MDALIRRLGQEDGQDMVEYALLLGFLSVGVFAALVLARDAIIAVWVMVTDIVLNAAALL